MQKNRIVINKEVAVTGLYFHPGAKLQAFPRRIEWEGGTYTFRDGLRRLAEKGEEIFEMTDGEQSFRLRNQASHWTLLEILPRGGEQMRFGFAS